MSDDLLKKAKQLPTPHFGATVPLYLLPTYFKLWNVEAVPDARGTYVVIVRKVDAQTVTEAQGVE